MKRSRLSEAQVTYALRQAEAGTPIGALALTLPRSGYLRIRVMLQR